MPYFPMYMNIKDKPVLVVGGGKIGARKVEKLIPFGPEITVISPSFDEAILNHAKDYPVELIERKFEMSDIDDRFMVIVAVDDIPLQESVYQECARRKTLVNTVDSEENCMFTFPAYILRDNLVVGISTSGTVPAVAVVFKLWLDKIIPKRVAEMVRKCSEFRSTKPEGKERMKDVFAYSKKVFEDL